MVGARQAVICICSTCASLSQSWPLGRAVDLPRRVEVVGTEPPAPLRKSKIGNKFLEPEPRLGRSQLGVGQTVRFRDCAVGASPDTCLSCSHCGGGHSCPVVGRTVRRQMDGFHSDRRELANLSQEVPGVHKGFQRWRRRDWIIGWMG